MALAPNLLLLGVPSQRKHGLVHGGLIEGIHIEQGIGDLIIDVLNRLQRAFAAVAGLITVAQFERFVVSTCLCRRSGPCHRSRSSSAS